MRLSRKETIEALLNQMQDDEDCRGVVGSYIEKWHDMIIADMDMLFRMTEVEQQNKKARDALMGFARNSASVDRMLGVKVEK